MEDTRRMRLRTKVVLGLAAMMVLMIAVIGVVMEQRRIMSRSFALLDQSSSVELLMLECRRQEKNFLLRHDESSVALYTASLDSLSDLAGELVSGARDERMAGRAAALREAAAEYGRLFTEIRERLPLGGELASDLDEVDRLMEETVAQARACHLLAREIREEAVAEFAEANTGALKVSIWAIVLGLVVAAVLAGWLIRATVAPMEQLQSLAEAVSVGDIQDADIEFRDLEMRRFNSRETHELAASLQRMISSLRVLVSSERGLMDDYHMTILVLVNRAVGPAGWAIIEKARAAAGFDSFAEVKPSNLKGFVAKLEEEVARFLPRDRAVRLSRAIEEMGR